jgi:hypothetical protein
MNLPFHSSNDSSSAPPEYHVEPKEIQHSKNIEVEEESSNKEEGKEKEEEEQMTTTLLQRPSREAKTRAQLIMEENDDRDFYFYQENKKPLGSKRRTIISNSSSNNHTKSKSKEKPSQKKQNQQNQVKPKKKIKNNSNSRNSSSSEDDSESDGDFVSVEKGDCILMDSGDNETFYVALVHAIHSHGTSKKNPGEFTAQWYYQPRDLRKETLAIIQDQLFPNEVFLTPHRDKNSMDAIIGLCNVVSPEEYESIQSEIKRGYREKDSKKKFFICRYKYKLTGPPHKALEPLKAFEIYNNHKKNQPRIGQAFQVEIPKQIEKKLAIKKKTDRSVLVWSPLMEITHQLVLGQYRTMLNSIRFAIGNIVKTFRTTNETMGHVRCIILRFENDPSTNVPNQPKICTSDGHVLDLTISSLCSPLSDDVAYKMLLENKFNVCHAVNACANLLMKIQEVERRAFKREVVLYKEIQRSMSNGSTRKRYSIRQTYGDDELDDDDDDDDEDDEDDSAQEENNSRSSSSSSSSSGSCNRNNIRYSYEQEQIKADGPLQEQQQYPRLQDFQNHFNINYEDDHHDDYDGFNSETTTSKKQRNVKEI